MTGLGTAAQALSHAGRIARMIADHTKIQPYRLFIVGFSKAAGAAPPNLRRDL
jgi:hypothetical protein